MVFNSEQDKELYNMGQKQSKEDINKKATDMKMKKSPEFFLESQIEKIFQQFTLCFVDLRKRCLTEFSSLNGLTPEGMFKIEARNPLYGERVLWETNYYRFKHIVTEKYLYIDENDNIGLTLKPVKAQLFNFSPIKVLGKDKDNRFVKKDQYFKIKNINGKWFRFPLA